jgi:hypothetical protein
MEWAPCHSAWCGTSFYKELVLTIRAHLHVQDNSMISESVWKTINWLRLYPRDRQNCRPVRIPALTCRCPTSAVSTVKSLCCFVNLVVPRTLFNNSGDASLLLFPPRLRSPLDFGTLVSSTFPAPSVKRVATSVSPNKAHLSSSHRLFLSDLLVTMAQRSKSVKFLAGAKNNFGRCLR